MSKSGAKLRWAKAKQFKPNLVPRYLPGSVGKSVAMEDLKMYNRHLLNVYCAEPVVNTKPPKMNPHSYIKTRRLVDDARRLNDIDKDNKELLKKINLINRTKGRVDSFNIAAYCSITKWGAHRKRMLRIEKDNRLMYDRLVTTPAIYPTDMFDKEWKVNINKMIHMAKYTMQMFLDKTMDRIVQEQPSISGGLEALGHRPLCFMNFRVKDGVHLGRIIIELYDDYVPLTAKNFLSICKGDSGLTYKNNRVHNVLAGQYCEMGDITCGNGKGGASIYGQTFNEENHKLKHTKTGVLSMKRIGKHGNNSQFSITFAPQEKLDGKRVVFGKVVKGIKTIYYLQDMARKIGPPVVPIIIEKCGEYKKPQKRQ